ncbi:hypothetical protein NGM10_15790 (plasmid) [Halorussus salilacus]|uniref:DUF7521 family protein n=1 Tax=Halorussus salilacus TaxID=2953750 RepID=UPI00209D1BDB|nr:hypothetical protein [Halorussus salilacus]USZ69865.1 hypothetical protein NGM10_15790 [Halorussus salilacus]
MQPMEVTYVVLSVALVVVGLALVGMAARAYVQTERRSMLFLTVGFSLVVAAAVATTFSAFLTEFSESRLLLTVNYAVTTVGYLFIVTSVRAD